MSGRHPWLHERRRNRCARLTPRLPGRYNDNDFANALTDIRIMQQHPNIAGALWLLIAGALLYFMFMLVFTVVFDERRPVHPEEYIPLAALVPLAAYLLAGKPR